LLNLYLTSKADGRALAALRNLAEAYRSAVLVGRQGEVVEALGRDRSRPVERGSRDGIGLARQRGIVETNEAGVSLEKRIQISRSLK
jgi:hypothetical protein